MMIVSTPALSDNSRISSELNTVAYILRRVEAEERLAEAERKQYQRRFEMIVWSILSIQVLECLVLIVLLVRR